MFSNDARRAVTRCRALEGGYRSFSIGSPGARSSCGWGFASPVVPGAASLLTFCVLTCSNVVTEATTTTTASATANKISAVRCLFMDKPPRATPASVGSVVRDRQGSAPGGCSSSLLDCSRAGERHGASIKALPKPNAAFKPKWRAKIS